MKLRYHIEGNLGSTVAVVDDDGVTRQLTAYYPSGVPYDLTAAEARTTGRLHIAGRWIDHKGMNTYDNTARMHYLCMLILQNQVLHSNISMMNYLIQQPHTLFQYHPEVS